MPRLKNHKIEAAAKSASSQQGKEKPGPKTSKPRKPPVRYSAALGALICEKLADGQSLMGICRNPGMPSDTAVRKWALDPEHPFSSDYARAREAGWHKMAEEIIEISDNGTNDYVARAKEDGAAILVDHDHISRSRLRVETRKWMLSKMLPKVYGDKVIVGGDQENPVKHQHGVSWMTKEDAEARGWA